MIQAVVITRERLRISGGPEWVNETFRQLDPNVNINVLG